MDVECALVCICGLVHASINFFTLWDEAVLFSLNVDFLWVPRSFDGMKGNIRNCNASVPLACPHTHE